MERHTLIAAHLSSVFASTAHVTSHAVQTTRRDIPLPTPRSDIPDGHATYSSLFHSKSTGHVLIRIVQGSLAVELISLAANVAPVRFVFPAAVVPAPALVTCGEDEIHLLVTTTVGSLYRIVLQIGVEGQFLHEPLRRDWCREWPIRKLTGHEPSLAHVHDVNVVFVTLTSGCFLRLESNYSSKSLSEHWSESEFRAHNWYSSLLTTLPSVSQPSEIVSLTTVPHPTDITDVFTVSRDRTIRRWTPAKGLRTEIVMNQGQPILSTDKSYSLLDSYPRKLIQAVTVHPTIAHIEAERHFLIAFNPTPTSASSGGVFTLYDIDNYHWKIVITCPASESSAFCKMQDFLYSKGKLYVLWEKQGQALLEVTPFRAGHDFEWSTTSYGQNSELTQSAIDELLLRPGSITHKFMTAILSPGVFSVITLKAALQDYKDHYLSLPGRHPPQLIASYPTLSESIAATVGCTVELTKDPHSGQALHSQYWNALRRDWEGFVARCREVERSARWPLALGLDHENDQILLFERERIGQYVEEDLPISLHRHLSENSPIDSQYLILAICWDLCLKIPLHLRQRIEDEILNIVTQEISFPLADIVIEASNKAFSRGDIDDNLEAWVSTEISSIFNIDQDIRNTLDAIGAVDKGVKQEEEEVELILPPPSTEWYRALVASYITESTEVRYQLSLTIGILMFYIGDDLKTYDQALLAEVFALIRGIHMLRYLTKQPAGDLSGTRPSPQGANTADDVVTQLNSMHVSQDGKGPEPTYSLMHVLLAQYGHPPVLPGGAHFFMDQLGLLSTETPTHATRFEVVLCEKLRLLGYREPARQLLEWLPRTPAVCYVRGRLWVDVCRSDEAALLFSTVAGCFGIENASSLEDSEALAAVLPLSGLYPTEFDYYLHIADVFRGASHLALEVSFTEKALSVIPPGESPAELSGSIIRGYTDLGLYEEAYSSLITLPHDDMKRQYVSQLVYKMCEEDALKRLLSLNFLGLAQEVETALSFKARNADPRVQPNYSQILYTWYITRGDYRNAAQTMYIRARKLCELQNDSTQVLALVEQQLDALGITLNSLSLIDGKSPWIVVPITPGNTRPRKRRKVDNYIPDEKFTVGRDVDVVSLSSIQEEYIHLTANLELIRRDATIVDSLSSPWITVSKLTQAGLYDLAMHTAKALSVDMSELFQRLALQCLRLSGTLDSSLMEVSASDWLLTDKVSSWPGSPADRGWRYLRQCLDQYDSSEKDFMYSKAVLETLFSHNPSSPPPPWLLQRIEDNHPEYLIRIYLKYGNLADSLKLTLRIVKKAAVSFTKGSNASCTWLPYPLIDAVIKGTEENVTQEVQNLRRLLQNEVSQRISRVQKQSQKSH